jgi:hypothetical protein
VFPPAVPPCCAGPSTDLAFRQLFDAASSTYTYIIADPETKEALLLDPVLEQVCTAVASTVL